MDTIAELIDDMERSASRIEGEGGDAVFSFALRLKELLSEGEGEEAQHVPTAGADWRVERHSTGGILYVTEDGDGEDEVVIPTEHATAIASLTRLDR